MKQLTGLDVSLKEIRIGFADADGKIGARGMSPADPEGVTGWLDMRTLSPKRMVHESGQLSIWLQRGLERLLGEILPCSTVTAGFSNSRTRVAVNPRQVFH